MEQVSQTTTNQFTQLICQLEFPQILPEDVFPTFIASPKILHYLDVENNTIWKDAVILQDEYEKESGLVFVQAVGKNIQLFGNELSNLVTNVVEFILKMTSKNWPGSLSNC